MFKLIGLFLGTFLSKIVYRVLGALGIAVFSYVGFDALVAQLYVYINSASGGLGATSIGLLGISGVDKYITIIISAHIAVFTIKSTFKVFGVK